jgi:hypothetical protein
MVGLGGFMHGPGEFTIILRAHQDFFGTVRARLTHGWSMLGLWLSLSIVTDLDLYICA